MRHLRRSLPLTAAIIGLFLVYLRMARAVTVNSDGASNALQAWDLFHGNLLLRGWTLSDVSFFPTELIQYGLIQLFTGLTADQIHIAAALSWTLVVVFAAWLAYSSLDSRSAGAPDQRSPGAPDDPSPGAPDDRAAGTPWTVGWRERGKAAGQDPALAAGRSAAVAALVRGGWPAAAIAVTILLVPAPGVGYQTLLSSPNHTGSAVPLLITWLLIDRARDRPWLPYAVAVVLAWGAMGDPLITFVGAAPLIAVGAYRALRSRTLRGVDTRLALAGAASVVVSHGALWLIERVGGFRAPHPPMELAPMSAWPERARIVRHMAGILSGTVRPGIQAPWVEATLQAVRVPGVVLVVVAVLLTVVAAVRGTADRVDAILAAAILCNLSAEIVSTLPSDLLATREIAPVLPMSAVLAARVTARWLRRVTATESAPNPTAAGGAPSVIATVDPSVIAIGHDPDTAADGSDPPARVVDVPGGAGPERIPKVVAAGGSGSRALNAAAAPGRAGRLRGKGVGRGPVRAARAGNRAATARTALALLGLVLAVQLVALVGYAPPRAELVEGQVAADWLRSRGLRYGLGSYWVSNNITVGTSRQVTVVPTLSGGGQLVGMCWQTHTDMYDPTTHDARFVLLEKQRPFYGTPEDVVSQYGEPVARQDFDLYVIFVYDRNLLEGFATTC